MHSESFALTQSYITMSFILSSSIMELGCCDLVLSGGHAKTTGFMVLLFKSVPECVFSINVSMACQHLLHTRQKRKENVKNLE